MSVLGFVETVRCGLFPEGMSSGNFSCEVFVQNFSLFPNGHLGEKTKDIFSSLWCRFDRTD